AALVLGRGAGGLGGDAGPGRCPRGPAGPVLGRAARDRLQPGVRQGRARVDRLGRGRLQADLAAAPGPAGTGDGRRLLLPGDADPPQRLTVNEWWSAQSSVAGSGTSMTRGPRSAPASPSFTDRTAPARPICWRPSTSA